MRGSKRGVSTIIGAIFFIGILFSAVIPMQLVMKQADNIALQRTHEAKVADLERENEDIEVYPVPILGEDKLNITLINNGEAPVKIVNIWINNRKDKPKIGGTSQVSAINLRARRLNSSLVMPDSTTIVLI